MNKLIIGLGSNTQDPIQQVKTALQSLWRLPKSKGIKVSSVYQTPALPTQHRQPDYVNAVARLESDLDPFRCLSELKKIERKHKRIRSQFWGPRSLDLDIIDYGHLNLWHDKLILPHPELENRFFWLLPLCEVDPHYVLQSGIPLREKVNHVHYQDLGYRKIPFHMEAVL